jgi:mono/diheme cytochrome c family protein
MDPAGKHVVIACQRHLGAAHGPTFGDDVEVVGVACSGMIHANTIGALTNAGATRVQVVGCAPDDCAYGIGNTILDERLRGDRAPHISRKYAGVAAEDWVAPGGLVEAIAHPNEHPDVGNPQQPNVRRWIGAVAVVIVSIAAVALATRAPYRGDDGRAGVLVVVDHTPGFTLEGQTGPTGRLGDDVAVVTRADGAEVARDQLPTSGDTAVGVAEVDLDPGEYDLDVSLLEGDSETRIFGGIVTLDDGNRLVVNAVDVPPPPGVEEGRRVFTDQQLGSCDVCHSTRPGDDGVGPSLAGIADRATTRVPGLDADGYLRQSILDPDAFIVEGFRAGQMLDIYEERLSPEQLDALIEYLLSLPGGGA